MCQVVPRDSLHSFEETFTIYMENNRKPYEMLEGLNSGVPTRTTATLTPTTLRNIEQSFIELQCQVEPHQNQAGFVPPIIHNQGVFMSIDTKSWHGGSTRLNDSQSSLPLEIVKEPSSPSPVSIPRRNVGGRRPNRDKSISPEEEEKRQVRRERNKMAAARCRKRRLDHTNELILETDGLEEKKQDLQKEIQKLQQEKDELEFILEAHKPCCRLIEPDSPPDIKPRISEKPEKIAEELAPPPCKKVVNPRPTTLSVPPAFTQQLPTEIAGVPITTPTAGIPFNFDSLMEGGTGLTPVSAPLVPSCSSQQRSNSGCVDLSSPDSSKLVSL